MIRVKSGVKFTTIKPEIYVLFDRIDDTWADRGLDVWITSAEDGKHKKGSLHYQGLAIDLRSKNLPSKAEKKRVLQELRYLTGEDYQVLLEYEGTANEHFHIEHDPK